MKYILGVQLYYIACRYMTNSQKRNTANQNTVIVNRFLIVCSLIFQLNRVKIRDANSFF